MLLPASAEQLQSDAAKLYGQAQEGLLVQLALGLHACTDQFFSGPGTQQTERFFVGYPGACAPSLSINVSLPA